MFTVISCCIYELFFLFCTLCIAAPAWPAVCSKRKKRKQPKDDALKNTARVLPPLFLSSSSPASPGTAEGKVELCAMVLEMQDLSALGVP